MPLLRAKHPPPTPNKLPRNNRNELPHNLKHPQRKLTHAQVKAMIERQTKEYGWQFLYMGADQDAIEVGASIGVPKEHAMTCGRVNAMMTATSANIGRYRTARAAGLSPEEAGEAMTYTDAQRSAAQE